MSTPGTPLIDLLARARRGVALHCIVARIAPLVGKSPLAVERALTTVPQGGTETALKRLANGDVPGAYLAALDTVYPRQSGMLIQAQFPPRRPGEATAALTAEESEDG